MTKEEKAALMKLPKACLDTMEYGSNCEDITSKWYFDTQTKLCYPFEYSGCSETQNKFETSEDCNSLCVNNLKNITSQASTEISDTVSTQVNTVVQEKEPEGRPNPIRNQLLKIYIYL